MLSTTKTILPGPGKCHWRRVLEVGHDYGRDAQHEAAHDLLGVVVELGIGEADAGAVEGDPRRPLHPHHQGAHGEDHPEHVHVVRREILGAVGALRGRRGPGSAALRGEEERVGKPGRRGTGSLLHFR